MKVNLRPPTAAKDGNATAQRLYEWAYELTEVLNIVLASIGEDNLSEDLRKKIEEAGNG